MSLIQLTLQDTPARPVMINTDHVATLKPLRAVLPSANTNTAGAVEYQERGTEIRMADGSRHNVLEHYDDVLGRLNPTVVQSNIAGLQEALATKHDAAVNKAVSGTSLRDDEVDQKFLKDLKSAGVPVSDTAKSTNLADDELAELKEAHAQAVANPVTPSADETAPAQTTEQEDPTAEEFDKQFSEGQPVETAEQPKKAPAKKAAAKKAQPKVEDKKDEGDA